MENYLGLPAAASAHAADIDRMLGWVHWFMLVLFVGWGIFFIYVLLRFRQSRNPKADYHGVTSHYTSYLEIAVAAVDAILIVGFAIPLWAQRVNAFPRENEATVAHVVAEQFAWNVHYAGPDGMFGRRDIKLVTADNPLGLDRSDANAKDDVATINQLNLPVNRPALIHLSSKDVIHSFGLPIMRVKQDAVPGENIPVWFIPTVVGESEIVCSQLCGLGHFRMRGFLNVQSDADFKKWMDEQVAEARKLSGN
jgi:cytochrome c oxidase subunit 2